MAFPGSTRPMPPLGSIVASRGSITYNAAHELADVLSPLVGKTEHHIQNSGDFVNKVKDLEVPPGQKLVSYDVSALFTSIPVLDAVAAIERKLNSDPLLHKCTPLSHKRVIELLSFCLNSTNFSYKGNIYKQKHGHGFASVPYHSQPVHGGVRSQGYSHSPNPPSEWLRYVDDTFVKIHEYFVNEFTEHLNSIDENIKFTTELETEGKLPFMDSSITLNDDGSLDLTVYRQPTHAEQYLNFDSNHHLQHKRFVVRTLINRANCMVTTGGQARTSVGLPYIRGTSEKLARIFKNH